MIRHSIPITKLRQAAAATARASLQQVIRDFGRNCFMLVWLVTLACQGLAQTPAEDLTTKDLSELMNMEVTSASRKEEQLFQIPAAVYVITQEDIRRSGLTSIPEILRMVPGLNVGRINDTTWAIGARGFNHRFANKMLVLIDGRSVYTPLFSGVFWNAQDLVLEDIERIEVIRGPGGTMWGANAVNGVINIITKHTRNSKGGLLSAVGGTDDRNITTLRFGDALGTKASYRAYLKYFNRRLDVDRNENINGLQYIHQHEHQWKQFRSGFRLDWDKPDHSSFMLSGDLYKGNETQKARYVPGLPLLDENLDVPDLSSGGNILARWNRILSPTADYSIQFYYDRANNNNTILDELRDTYNVEAQHHRVIGKRHDVVLGAGYRYSAGNTDQDNDDWLQVNSPRWAFNLFSVFAQDKITLKENKLWLTLGSKLEHYDFAGFQLQPSARVLWMPNGKNALWASVSRAVRVPSRIERDTTANAANLVTAEGLTASVRLIGNHRLKSEELVAAEVGYRTQLSNRVYFDVAFFRNAYDRLKTAERGIPYPDFTVRPPVIIVPVDYANLMKATTFGGEIAANVNITSSWKLSGSYTMFVGRFHRAPQSQDINYELVDLGAPRNQFQIHSQLTLKSRFEIDNAFYYVGALDATKVMGDAIRFVGNLQTISVPNYLRFDTRLGWRVRDNFSLSIVGQNLLDPSHQEVSSFGQGILTDQVRRAFYGKVTWTF